MKVLPLLLFLFLLACNDSPTVPPPPDGVVYILATAEVCGVVYTDADTVVVRPGESVKAMLHVVTVDECDDD